MQIMRRPGEIAIALSLTVAAIGAGYALYSCVGPFDAGRASLPRADQSARVELAMQTEPVGEPVRVANPFDASEVFEFPAGTSEADANEAVAGFLIERATRRGAVVAHKHAGSKRI
jgi:hypothetical protein